MSVPIIIAGAFPYEISGIKKRGSFRRMVGTRYLKGEIDGTLTILAVSGIGEERAYRAAKDLISYLPATRAYISIGLSASLVPDIRAGAVIGATEIISASSNNSYPCDPGLIDALSKINCRTGKFVCVKETVVSSAEKKEIASSTGAIALDMESAGAARACAEAGVPFISIRAISDELSEDLPVDFDPFMRDGKIDTRRLIVHVLAHPGKIIPLMRLGRNSGLARERLGDVVSQLIRVMRFYSCPAKST